MYERFTDRARKVMQLANQEAQRFNHEYIGTEHILLGLVKEGSGVAANVLKNLDIDLRKVRLEVEKLVRSGPDMVTAGKLPQTPAAKRVVDYSMEEARRLNHNYIGTEHILLGLLREDQGVAAAVLKNLGLRLDELREEVLVLLGYPRDAGTPVLQEPSVGQPATPPPTPMHCDFGKCNDNATFHLTYVKRRKCDREAHFCELHARTTIVESYSRLPANHSARPAILPDAKNFDIDLLVLTDTYGSQVVSLREVGGERTIPVITGVSEAKTLRAKLKDDPSPWPLIHDVVATLIRTVGASVQDVIIHNLEQHKYYAIVRVPHGNELKTVDVRPTDAFMLAVAFDCPIFVMDKVLEQLGQSGGAPSW